MDYKELFQALTFVDLSMINDYEITKIEMYQKQQKKYCKLVDLDVLGLEGKCEKKLFTGQEFHCTNKFFMKHDNEDLKIREFLNDIQYQLLNAEQYFTGQKSYYYTKTLRVNNKYYKIEFRNKNQIDYLLKMLTTLKQKNVCGFTLNQFLKHHACVFTEFIHKC